jgi:hypothetical protein
LRIWDVPCALLTDKHLLGEHVELHVIWNAHVRGLKGGYSRHPETLRWVGHLEALRRRHSEQVAVMISRAFRHASPLQDLQTDGESADWPSVTLPGSIPAEATKH